MKITPFGKDVENISKLDDRPNIENGYTSLELKKLFDKASVDIKEYINKVLIEELSSFEQNASGADKIGSGEIDLLPSGSVQEKLEGLNDKITDLANGTIPDGSITPDKFSNDIKEFLTEGSIRFFGQNTAGESTFTVARSGTYKITLQGAGAGGGLMPGTYAKRLGGTSGAYVVLYRDLAVGDKLTFTVGEGGKGLKTENKAKVSDATDGGDTILLINGVEVAKAQGGKLGTGEKARATGGFINKDGTYAVVGALYDRNVDDLTVDFIFGADSPLGSGGHSSDDIAGTGAGGYSGEYVSTNNYRAGGDGGNGLIMIEYLA